MAIATILRLAPEKQTKALPRKLKFTVTTLEGIKPPLSGRVTVYDAKTAGLAFTVTDKGERSFYVIRRIHGRPNRLRLGGVGMTIDQARTAATMMQGSIAGGDDPAEDRRQNRRAGTLGEMWEAYRDEHLKPRCSARTILTDENRFDTCLDEWSARKVLSIPERDVRDLHDRLGKKRGHTTANRAVQLLRRIFNWARLPNPAGKSAVTMFRETSRSRFVQPDELPKLFKALNHKQTNPLIRDFVYLCLWTGARRSAVASMRDEEINLAAATWTIPPAKSKNAEAVTIPLSPEAVEIIKRRMGHESGFILPSHGESDIFKTRKTLERRFETCQTERHPHSRSKTNARQLAGRSGLSLTIIAVHSGTGTQRRRPSIRGSTSTRSSISQRGYGRDAGDGEAGRKGKRK